MSFSHLLVACDFSAPSREAMGWARLMRARLSCAVTVVHVDVEAGGHVGSAGAGWISDAQRRRHDEFIRQEVRREVAELFGPDEQAIDARIVKGRPAEAIAALAREIGADLVVVGASGKNAVDRMLLGSTTHELLRRGRLPLMVIR